ncbi:MAG: sensor histidine kinase [Sphingobacteriales bacterium]|nr:sensor histidine kinase [Sphingobacteriales bacterium]
MSNKNPTPNEVALGTSAVIAALCFILLLVYRFAFNNEALSVPAVFGIAFFVFAVAFLLFRAAIEEFIYRKIKLIYKSISEVKYDKDKKQRVLHINMNEDIYKKVEEEVVLWAEKKEEQIVRLEQMENYRKQFLGNVSHELKTPIFNIQGYVQTLIDGGLHDPAINIDYLLKADNNIERMIHIIEDLENISLLENGVYQLEKQRFDIRQLTKEIFEMLDIKANANKIKLSVKKGCEGHYWVHADKEKIRQVLVNLIDNSIKYGKAGGGITQVGFYDMASNILIEVSDDGIGISEEHLSHVFDRFYRVDKSRSRAMGGTGLGLAIVKHIIEAHQQHIRVRSKLGVGSTFGFMLQKSDK